MNKGKVLARLATYLAVLAPDRGALRHDFDERGAGAGGAVSDAAADGCGAGPPPGVALPLEQRTPGSA